MIDTINIHRLTTCSLSHIVDLLNNCESYCECVRVCEELVHIKWGNNKFPNFSTSPKTSNVTTKKSSYYSVFFSVLLKITVIEELVTTLVETASIENLIVAAQNWRFINCCNRRLI